MLRQAADKNTLEKVADTSVGLAGGVIAEGLVAPDKVSDETDKMNVDKPNQLKSMKRKLRVSKERGQKAPKTAIDADKSSSSDEELEEESLDSFATSKAGLEDDTDLGTSNAGVSLGFSGVSTITQPLLKYIVPNDIVSSDTSLESNPVNSELDSKLSLQPGYSAQGNTN